MKGTGIQKETKQKGKKSLHFFKTYTVSLGKRLKIRKTQHQEKEKKKNKSHVLVPSLGTTSILPNLWAQILAY